jgi:hypothetical protein
MAVVPAPRHDRLFCALRFGLERFSIRPHRINRSKLLVYNDFLTIK